MRVTIITNIPTPYRDLVYERCAAKSEIDLSVIYCSPSEPNRGWRKTRACYNMTFLKTASFRFHGQYTHFATGVGGHLDRLQPDVVVTSGFGPVMLSAFFWCLRNGKPHVPFTDGTPASEGNLTAVHRAVRRLVFRRSVAFLGASKKSSDLYRRYGISCNDIFESCLCIDNDLYRPDGHQDPEFDLLFVGQFIDRKMPVFAAKVAVEVQSILGQCRLLLVGDGPLKGEVEAFLADSEVNFEMTGFVQPEELPAKYKNSKIFLFPTKRDPWGVVANEACAAGLPVITTSEAGAAGELVLDRVNGRVLPPNVAEWANVVVGLLSDRSEYNSYSEAAMRLVGRFNPKEAADGLIEACQYALSRR